MDFKSILCYNTFIRRYYYEKRIHTGRGSGNFRYYRRCVCHDSSGTIAKSPEKSYVTQIHKVYNELQQAALQYMTDKNAVNLVEAGLTNNINAVDAFMKTYFRVVKECGSEPTETGCVAQEYKNLRDRQ